MYFVGVSSPHPQILHVKLLKLKRPDTIILFKNYWSFSVEWINISAAYSKFKLHVLVTENHFQFSNCAGLSRAFLLPCSSSPRTHSASPGPQQLLLPGSVLVICPPEDIRDFLRLKWVPFPIAPACPLVPPGITAPVILFGANDLVGVPSGQEAPSHSSLFSPLPITMTHLQQDTLKPFGWMDNSTNVGDSFGMPWITSAIKIHRNDFE